MKAAIGLPALCATPIKLQGGWNRYIATEGRYGFIGPSFLVPMSASPDVLRENGGVLAGLGIRHEVYLNGEYLSSCVGANESLGFAIVLAESETNPKTIMRARCMSDGVRAGRELYWNEKESPLVYEIKRGKVEIRHKF